MLALFHLQPQSTTSLREQNSSVNSLILVLKKVAVMIHGNVLHVTVKMGFIRLKVLILINHTVQGHITTNSESTFLLKICIEQLPEF